MMLLTKPIKAKLLANGKAQDGTKDFKPALKLFMTATACTWLISEIVEEEDGDIIFFGLCDLGMGEPELGNVSLNELKSAARGMRFLERDRYFTATKLLGEYATDAREARRITV